MPEPSDPVAQVQKITSLEELELLVRIYATFQKLPPGTRDAFSNAVHKRFADIVGEKMRTIVVMVGQLQEATHHKTAVLRLVKK